MPRRSGDERGPDVSSLRRTPEAQLRTLPVSSLGPCPQMAVGTVDVELVAGTTTAGSMAVEMAAAAPTGA